MTTPQSQLYDVSYKVNQLIKMFQGDEGEVDIFEAVKQLNLQMQEILHTQQRQENCMNLILKLLAKNE